MVYVLICCISYLDDTMASEQASSERMTDLNLGVLIGLPQPLSCVWGNTTSSSSGPSDAEYGASQESDAPACPRALCGSRSGAMSDLLRPSSSPAADGISCIEGHGILQGMFP